MKIKLDQNLGERGRQVFTAAGHDVCTASAQGLGSASDEEILRRCTAEGRVLVSLDLDFADTLRFPPETHAGVAVLRVPEERGSSLLPAVMAALVQALEKDQITARLWVVEPGRIRIHKGGEE